MTRSNLTTLVVSFALAAGASTALAGPNDADVAAKVNVFEFNAKAFDKRSTNGEWDQVKYAIDNMADAIKSIQKLDPTRDVSALVKRLDAARAAFEAHKQKETGDRENAKKIDGVERAHRHSIRTVEELQNAKRVLRTQELEELVAALRALDEVERTCKETASTRPSCALAAKRAEIAKATLDQQLEIAIAAELKEIADGRAAVAEDGTVLATRVRFHDVAALEKSWSTRYTVLAELVGTPVPGDRFRPIIDAATAYLGDLPKAAKVARLPKGMGAAPAAVVKDVAATYPKAKVLKVIASGAWTIHRDEFFKRPERRIADGAALIQEPGESHCRMVRLLVVAPYLDGAYAPTRLDHVRPEYQVSACR